MTLSSPPVSPADGPPTVLVVDDENEIRGALRQVLRAACTDPVTCNNPDGTPLADTQIVNPTGGYMALPLKGIWARAP